MIFLSICIPTLPDEKSKAYLASLRLILDPQLTEEVEIIIDDRFGDRKTQTGIPTGRKRNEMYSKALGSYVISLDCDDWVSPTYVEDILIAIKNNYPDVVTFCGWYTENGVNHLDWTIKLGEKYEARFHDGKYQIFRWPNHLSAMRKELAVQVKFPDVWHGEDYQWSKELADRKILKTEIHIPKQLYHYIYKTDK